MTPPVASPIHSVAGEVQRTSAQPLVRSQIRVRLDPSQTLPRDPAEQGLFNFGLPPSVSEPFGTRSHRAASLR